mgnify:CR=1 FL=1
MSFASTIISNDSNFSIEEKTNFARSIAFAYSVKNNYPISLTKGKPVSIVGYLDQDKWEKDGKQNTLTFIVADKIQMFGGQKSGNTESKGEDLPDDNFPPEGDFPEDVPF